MREIPELEKNDFISVCEFTAKCKSFFDNPGVNKLALCAAIDARLSKQPRLRDWFGKWQREGARSKTFAKEIFKNSGNAMGLPQIDKHIRAFRYNPEWTVAAICDSLVNFLTPVLDAVPNRTDRQQIHRLAMDRMWVIIGATERSILIRSLGNRRLGTEPFETIFEMADYYRDMENENHDLPLRPVVQAPKEKGSNILTDYTLGPQGQPELKPRWARYRPSPRDDGKPAHHQQGRPGDARYVRMVSLDGSDGEEVYVAAVEASPAAEKRAGIRSTGDGRLHFRTDFVEDKNAKCDRCGQIGHRVEQCLLQAWETNQRFNDRLWQCMICGGRHFPQVCFTLEKKTRSPKPEHVTTSEAPPLPGPRSGCYNCGQKGHIRATCPSPLNRYVRLAERLEDTPESGNEEEPPTNGGT
jgi:hypothetical protein